MLRKMFSDKGRNLYLSAKNKIQNNLDYLKKKKPIGKIKD